MSFDFSTFLPADTIEHEVIALDRKTKTGWIITLAGPAHPQTIAATNVAIQKAHRDAVAEETRSPTFDVRGVKLGNVEWIASRIVGWTPLKIGDVAYEYSKETAIDLLMRDDLAWVVTQIANRLSDDANFMKRSATKS